VSLRIAVLGAGAAGYFCALRISHLIPNAKVTVLEKSQHTLSKVKISGGGRCNVTHACFDPRELVGFYPRGHKELLGPFHRFQPGDTIQWFEERGVPLKVEDDGRMFPITNSSQTIIDCFEEEARKNGVKVWMQAGVQSMRLDEGIWHLELTDQRQLQADRVVVATGSSALAWDLLKKINHTIVEPVPSLFTFTIADERLQGLAGISSPWAQVEIEDSEFESEGPLLITHWGLSGPGVLKISAWAARFLAEKKYRFFIRVNWEGHASAQEVEAKLKNWRDTQAKKNIGAQSPFSFPNRLWMALVNKHHLAEKKWGDLSNAACSLLVEEITACRFEVNGKSTYKDEFVTAGGVSLKEIDFKTMQSKLWPHLYFAGEVMDIDAVTGGFNFQAAWTTAWIAAESIAASAEPSN
jgi:predicted Rossmann fold flavoprotein